LYRHRLIERLARPSELHLLESIGDQDCHVQSIHLSSAMMSVSHHMFRVSASIFHYEQRRRFDHGQFIS
jgi:hypothetical protein